LKRERGEKVSQRGKERDRWKKNIERKILLGRGNLWKREGAGKRLQKSEAKKTLGRRTASKKTLRNIQKGVSSGGGGC